MAKIAVNRSCQNAIRTSLVMLAISALVLAFLMLTRDKLSARFAKKKHAKMKLEDLLKEETTTAVQAESTSQKTASSSSDAGDRDFESVRVEVPGCGCTRTQKRPKSTADIPIAETTCGPTAFSRGAGQKVIAYSYFAGTGGKDSGERKYFSGIRLNAEAARRLYPGWAVRVYHNLTEGGSAMAELCRLACKEDHLDLCQVSESPMLGDARWIVPTVWRFMPLADGQVDISVFRDLDSLLSKRERSAVSDWERSKHRVHVMRDHPGHDMSMLAGMWGAKVNPLRNTWRKTLLAILESPAARPPHDKNLKQGSDQVILKFLVWPWASGMALQHDSYTCHQFGRTSPWPTKREEGDHNFVGAPFALKGAKIEKDCPERCRPREHKTEWTKC